MAAGWPRLLMIGLDAAEASLVESWTADGSLPHLKRLLDRGAYGRLASTADWLSGSPWPTFYTGTPPGEHGLYHYLSWYPDSMSAARPTPDRLPLTHFWRDLSARGPRVVAIDVPRAYAPEPFNGVEISGWGTHETPAIAAYPPSLLRWVRATFGPRPRTDEVYTRLPLERLLETRDQERRVTEQVLAIALALMEREAWDLFIVCLGATHRGGHKLWDGTGTSGSPEPGADERLRAALLGVYTAVDAAVGRLIEAAGPGTTTLVFSVHGMGPNTSRTDVLAQMLSRVLGRPDGDGAAHPVGALDRFRGFLPGTWRHAVKRRLPLSLQDRLTAYWRLKGIDWGKTRAFTLVADLQGYIRVNLKGREALGIVAPGAEQEDLCDQIADGLRMFVDADTGQPVVRSVASIKELYPDGGRRDHLPDLIVQWSATPSADHREIVSARHGHVQWPTPGKNASGRSGNHWPEGFLIATGERFQPGSRLEGAHILDLVPTVFDLFGLPPPTAMQGRTLAEK
ncbi:MAG TPA: alkaline phosphatase family protein [Gemmatimonadota bacterium]|nr:alkaline phosphatase family protein [Gemmatimonadota bacterium]